MKNHAIIGLVSLALISGAAAQVGETQNQNTNVTVNVADITAIDVRPSSLTYNNVAPGADRTESEGNFTAIEIENIGSSRVGEIYAQATMPTQQPFGTYSDAEDDTPHNTGNFVTLSLNSAQSYGIQTDADFTGEETPHYLNRVEYAEDNYPTYITVDENGEDFNSSNVDSSVDSPVDVGRFRVGGAEYFFAFYDLSSGSALRIGDTPHTSTQLGTTDLSSDGEDYTTYTTSGGGLTAGAANGGSVFEVNSHSFVSFDTTSDEFGGESLIEDGSPTSNVSGLSNVQNRSYSLFYDAANERVLRTTFNVAPEVPGGYDSEATGAPSDDNWQVTSQDTGAQEYILDASSQTNALQPGQNFPVDFGIQVPQGVDQNAIQEGTVTVIASDEIGDGTPTGN